MTGPLTVAGSVTIPATNAFVVGGASIYASASQSTFFVSGTTCYCNYNIPSGNFEWAVNTTLGMQLVYNSGLFVTLQGFKPGGGAWADSSDIRIKDVEGDYTTGLDDVCKLRPVTFSFKGNDTRDPPAHVAAASDDPVLKESLTVPYPNSPHYQSATNKTTYHGLIAQEVESIFPEMVTQRGGYIDGAAVDDLRDLNTTPLIYALVNAIKELKARVEALEAPNG